MKRLGFLLATAILAAACAATGEWSPTPSVSSPSLASVQPSQAQLWVPPSSEAVESVRPTPHSKPAPSASPRRKAPAPTRKPATRYNFGPSLVGAASTYGGSQYNGLTAVPYRSWRGHLARICYRNRCVIRRINDYGPARRLNRVADLDGPTFNYLCRCNWRNVGVLRGVKLTRID